MEQERDVIFNENTFFNLQELEKSVLETIMTMKVPILSTELLGGLILEDFESN